MEDVLPDQSPLWEKLEEACRAIFRQYGYRNIRTPIVEPTAPGDWHSVALHSDGSYGIEKGLITSFPVRSNGQKVEIVQGLTINDFSRSRIDATINELMEEREMVSSLLTPG